MLVMLNALFIDKNAQSIIVLAYAAVIANIKHSFIDLAWSVER